MPDREEVIERLGKVSHYFKSLRTVGWQVDANIYREHQESVNMAIALLKEQEPVKPVLDAKNDWYRCGKCGNNLASGVRVRSFGIYKWPVYCEKCGKKVKWDA